MPDLINPIMNDGKVDHIVWHNELCASCLNVGACEFISMIHAYEIIALSGISVASCKHYSPDTESEYYVDQANEADRVQMEMDATRQKMEQLAQLMGVVGQWPRYSAT